MVKKKENKEISLLENPNIETQAKMSAWRVALRIFIISLLFVLITFGYVIKFSAGNYIKVFSYNLISTKDASNFYEVKNGDLVVVKSVSDYADIKQGDIVCFVSNAEKGSGKVVGFKTNALQLEVNGEIKIVSIRVVVGLQTKTIAVLGYIFEFVSSYVAIIIFNIILIAYVTYLTFTRINYENTEKGIKLYRRFKQDKKERLERIKLQKKNDQIHGVDYEIARLLEGSFEENKEAITNYKSNLKLSFKEKYKHILTCIHDGYLCNKELTKLERMHITKVVELMCVSQDMDNDIEYMVVDLLLKTRLTDFDVHNFTESSIEFLNSKLDDDDLLNFASVLYIIVYENRKYRQDLKRLVDFFLQKAQYLERKDQEFVFKTALTISKIIK